MKELKSKKLIVGSKKYFDYLAEEKISVALQIEGDLNEGATQRFHMKADNIIRCRQEIAALTRAGVNVGLANMYLDRIESNSEAFFDSIDWNESNPPTRHRNRPGLPNIRITGLDEGLDELRETLQPLARYLGNDAINNTLTNIANAANAAIDASANVAGAARDVSVNALGDALLWGASMARSISNLSNINRIQENYEFNQELEKQLSRGFINDQSGGVASQFRMGNSDGDVTTAGNGCGWIAIYNAGIVLQKNFSPADIILYLEDGGGFLRDGEWGTNPHTILSFLRSNGINAQMLYLAGNLDEAIRNARVGILAYQHGQGLLRLADDGAHWVAIRHVGRRFEIFNDHVRFTESIDRWLVERDVLSLITVH